MNRVEYLVIGAGITGLSFANFVNSDDYLILESENEIGGYCRTIYRDEFVWDYSGHFFHFRDPEIKRFFAERVHSDDVVTVNKATKILYQGSLIDYPFQKNIHQLEKDEFIDCLFDLYFRDQLEYSNFKEMLYSKFGRSISEKFLIPCNEKLYACDLETLESDAMGRFFPYADLGDVISNFKQGNNTSYNDTFMYPKKGAMQFVRALQEGLDTDKICTGERVLAIDIHRKKVQTSKRTITYENLITTIPFPILLDMVGLEEYVDRFSWNKVLVFNIGFDRKGTEGLHWVYVPEEKFRFYRVGFYDNILGTDKMSLYVEVGLSKDAEVDVEQEFDEVVMDLRKSGLISDEQIVCYEPVLMDPAYVHRTEESNELFQNISSALRARGIYTIGRYGGWKYCSIEDNIIEAKQTAELFNLMSFHKCGGIDLG